MLNRFRSAFFRPNSVQPAPKKPAKCGAADLAIGVGLAVGAYHYPKFLQWEAEQRVSFFVARLTPQQRAEMMESKEKNDKYREQLREEIRFEMKPD